MGHGWDFLLAGVEPVLLGGDELPGAARVPLPAGAGPPHLLLLPVSDQLEPPWPEQARHLDHPVLLPSRMFPPG